jgi:hypothetical protein
MTSLRTDRRWLTSCLGILLGVLAMNAAAIDPATVKGTFRHGGKVYALKHVYAWQPYAQTEALWIYLTDAEVPAAAAKDLLKPAKLAREGGFRGVRFVINPTKTDLTRLEGDIYAGEGSTVTGSGVSMWQHLRVGDKRVVGKVKYEEKDGDWSLEAEFSAPVFGSSGKLQTLTGAQAQKSPQAEVFLAYEKAFFLQGTDAVSAYMTPERLDVLRDYIKQRGAEAVKKELDAMGKVVPQGEARRKQIEEVVVDGDNAVLKVRSKPTWVQEFRLAKINDGWKIAP